MSRIIANFIAQYRKPFSINMMSALVALPLSECEAAIQEGIDSGRVKQIEPGIYIVRKAASHTTRHGSNHWRYDVDSATMVLDALPVCESHSCRALGQHLGVSTTYIMFYLRALASIGCIRAIGKRYEEVRRDNIHEIGTRIDPGVMRRIRSEAGINQNGQHGPINTHRREAKCK